MGIPYEPPLFDPSVGLLLRDDLHHAFDRLQWSFYYRVGADPYDTVLNPGRRVLRPLLHLELPWSAGPTWEGDHPREISRRCRMAS